MKLNKYKIYTISLGFLSGLSVLGNVILLKKDTESNKKITKIKIEMEGLEERIEELEEIDQLETLEDLNEYFSGYLSFYYDEYAWMFGSCSPQLTIKKPEFQYKKIEMTSSLYRKINMIISKYSINSLELIGLDKDFDISKLELLSNNQEYFYDEKRLEELIIKETGKDFNYEQLGEVSFEYINIIVDDCTESMKNWLGKINLKNTEITIHSNDYDPYLKLFIDTRKEIDTLKILSDSNEEGLSLIADINAKKVIIDSRRYYQEKLDFNLDLNNNTESIEISFTNYDGEMEEGNYLGRIKITSNNPNLSINITSEPGFLGHVTSRTYVTENTRFDLPEQSTIRFHNIRCQWKKEKLNGTVQYEKEDSIEEIVQKVEEDYQKTIGSK